MRPFRWSSVILAAGIVVVALGAWAIVALGATMAGAYFATELAYLIPFGWYDFLARTLPELRLGPGAIATGLFGVTALLLAGDRFACWLHDRLEMRTAAHLRTVWHFRWSATLLALAALFFVAGICMLGIAHHAAWLYRPASPVLDVKTSWERRRAAETERGVRP